MDMGSTISARINARSVPGASKLPLIYFVAIGTLIGAYGDLLGCPLQWDLACLP